MIGDITDNFRLHLVQHELRHLRHKLLCGLVQQARVHSGGELQVRTGLPPGTGGSTH